MKVRIGIGSTGQVANPTTLEELCRELVACGFDSIWVSEVLSQPGLDPFVAMAWLAGRFESLKIGATFLVPGRNILRLARQLASLDVLSNGQLLLTAVPGLLKAEKQQQSVSLKTSEVWRLKRQSRSCAPSLLEFPLMSPHMQESHRG